MLPRRPLPLIILFVVILVLALRLAFCLLAGQPALPDPPLLAVVRDEAETTPPAPDYTKPPRSPHGLPRPNARTRLFSARAAEFFAGRRSSTPCQPRFFMTWIAPAESLGPRELLSIESLFKSHPNACLLILSNSLDTSKGEQLLRPFLNKGFRVAALSPDLHHLSRDTPAAAWLERLRRGAVQPGTVPLAQNLSNLLRLLVLYKFGGVYIDADIIIVRSFSGLRNAIGAQSADLETGKWTRLNNAVMVFDAGHPLLREFIAEFVRTFDGSRWGHNGPYLVSRVASRVAGRRGFDFAVMPVSAFYPVDWNGIKVLFREPLGGKQAAWAAAKLEGIRREGFAVHLWNSQSKATRINRGSVVGRIIEEQCIFCNSSVFS